MNPLEHARWHHWITRAEDMLGHDLNGVQGRDGTSIDGAVEAFLEGASVVEYVLDVKARETP